MLKTRARLSILNTLLSFPTIRNSDWRSAGYEEKVQVGDLVSLSSAPVSKWYLSWLRDIVVKEGWEHYLLESVDEGDLSWWHNVGLSFYNREKVRENFRWCWDDKQYAFNDRWMKVCKRYNDHILTPLLPVFGEGTEVVLDVRVRLRIHTDSSFRRPLNFKIWKKLTMKTMAEYYQESQRIHSCRTSGES